MRIKKIIFDQFMGLNHAEYTFDGNAIVYGANGSGKTTLGMAPYWVIADKDYSMNSNPEVHPTFLEESEPSTEIIYDINGKDVSFKKIQKDARTKKQKEEGVPVRIKNVYEVNAVPKSQKDFDAALAEYGINKDDFLLFTHPEKFMGEKTADCRKILFGMTSVVTDKSIADKLGFAELSAMMDNYKVDEIEAMMKREKKNASERIEAIPQQIIGLEKAKVVVDTKSIEEQATSIQAQIYTAQNNLEENPVSTVDQLNEQLLMNGQKLAMLNEKADHERSKKYDAAKSAESAIVTKLQARRKELAEKQAYIAAEVEKVQVAKKAYEDLGNEFASVKAEKFDEDSNICKYCGQPLPEHTQEENRNRFLKIQQERKDQINAEAIRYRNIARVSTDNAKLAEESLPEIKSSIADLERQLTEAETTSKIFEVPTDASGTDEYKKLVAEQDAIKQMIADRDRAIAEQETIKRSIHTWKEELLKLHEELAMVKVNAGIDKQISELREEQKHKAQTLADAEKILYQLSQISMKKNELLTDQVNSHFTRVKFRLFRYQKNGEVKDDCTPMVLNSNGEYMDATFSANTAAIELAKLDIIAGLQKFYGVDYPVILDGAECLDSTNSIIDVPFQLIQLRVSDDPELVIK